MPNLYATLDNVKDRLGITSTTDDAIILSLLESASRTIDVFCKTHFYTEIATRYYDGKSGNILLDDILSITTATTDSEADGTYDGTTLTENTDFYLRPDNSWPKWEMWQPPWMEEALTTTTRSIKIVGTFGYGDGESSDPWSDSGYTGTVADATTTTVTASASDVIEAGSTIRIESEQMYVSAVSGTSLTVTRGVNGTTAAAHSSKAIELALYPRMVIEAAIRLASRWYEQMDAEGLSFEQIGAYSYRIREGEEAEFMLRMLGPLRRLAA